MHTGDTSQMCESCILILKVNWKCFNLIEWMKWKNSSNLLSLNPFKMVHHNQVNKETTVLCISRKLLSWGQTVSTPSFSWNKWGRTWRKMQHKQAVGHECARVICKAASQPDYWRLAASPLSTYIIIMLTVTLAFYIEGSKQFPALRFWWVIITFLYYLMLQSWYWNTGEHLVIIFATQLP